jgi:hypothetical protein
MSRRTMKKPLFHLALCLILLSAVPSRVWAQEEEGLTLKVRRQFGYGDGFRIQGQFRLEVSGREGLRSVEFIIDGKVVFIDDEPPFRYDFDTQEYTPGVHTFSAVGVIDEGTRITSDSKSYQILSAEEARSSALNIVIPIIALVVVFSLLGILGPALLGRRKDSFRLGEYSAAGGAVCSRCSMPFSRHVFSPNLLLGKLERCPHCGKWALVRRASRRELEAAEEAYVQEREKGKMMPKQADKEKMRRLLEESRFEE